MISTRRNHLRLLCAAAVAESPMLERSLPSSAATLSKESFLSEGKIISVEDIGHGVTKPLKVGLELTALSTLPRFRPSIKIFPTSSRNRAHRSP